MKKFILTLIFPVLLLSCENCDCPEPKSEGIIDHTEMEAQAQLMKLAFANKDVDAMLDLFTDDLTWWLPNNQVIQGKEQAKAVFEDVFSRFEIMTMDTPKNAAGDDFPPIIMGTTSEENGNWLLRWSPFYYKALNGKEVTMNFHTAIAFNEENKIRVLAAYYDRSLLINLYENEDPLKALE
ncbi:MAG: hypothetical protein CMC79_01445 [Flavobacteriaceae bacterium]|nr:hypothetical protein [Flavobacteriaceae bacterium]